MTNDGICVACSAPIPTESGMLCRNCMDGESNFNTTKVTVLLDKITDVKDFVNLASMCPDDVVAKSGHYTINAKSIMALFSLDLSKPIRVEFYGSIPCEVKAGMKKFIVK